jgi:hypothetical protein
MQNHTHRMTLFQRALSRALDFVEGRIVPALPRGRRQHVRAYIDRAQARLHSRALDHDQNKSRRNSQD